VYTMKSVLRNSSKVQGVASSVRSDITNKLNMSSSPQAVQGHSIDGPSIQQHLLKISRSDKLVFFQYKLELYYAHVLPPLIYRLINESTSSSDIAVICRTDCELRAIHSVLSKAAINFQTIEDSLSTHHLTSRY